MAGAELAKDAIPVAVNMVKDAVTFALRENNAKQSLPNLGSALPDGHNSKDLVWPDDNTVTLKIDVNCGMTLAADLKSEIGVKYDWGGKFQDQGAYLCNVDLFAEVTSIPWDGDVSIEAKFGDVEMEADNVAKLPFSFTYTFNLPAMFGGTTIWKFSGSCQGNRKGTIGPA